MDHLKVGISVVDIFHMLNIFTLYPGGHCEYYIVETLDFVILLHRVLIFYFSQQQTWLDLN